MTRERLQCIVRLIEYDRLTPTELNFLLQCVQLFMAKERLTAADEENLETLFANTQWREKSITGKSKKLGDEGISAEEVFDV